MTESATDTQSIPAGDKSRIRQCLDALEDRKAEDLKVLDVRGQSTVTDYLILATGNSQPHLRALRTAAEKAFKEQGADVLGVDNIPESGWLVVDAYDIMVHLFTTEQRGNYRLESLWKDAVEVEI
ncbi:ribosome silencing factor [Ruficoccus amylovorans]|uniref:ribosome silencing factor n=1 Tax=Ruficoccus amylovorans TaxID=1804625 RepID=UPI0031B59C3D